VLFNNPWRHYRYVRRNWLEIMRFHGMGRPLAMLEIGAGASVLLPKALAAYGKQSRYITINENQALTQAFRRKTRRLSIQVDIIEGDAADIKEYLPPKSVDILAFEHSMNDILQAILLERDGIDTARGDWFKLLPEMIARINEAYCGGQFEAKLKAPFIALLQNCAETLKPGGLLALSHYMFQYDLDLGYDRCLWENMLPIVRPWLAELTCGREVAFEGFDAQWWFFWEKC
jgi:SAM-dependent methyltransferase